MAGVERCAVPGCDTLSNVLVDKGLGFVVSARGSLSWLDPEHPWALEPGKRPRLTPNPALAMRNGGVWMLPTNKVPKRRPL